MYTPILYLLDARDRALFERWALSDRTTQRARRPWLALTALGGALSTITLTLVPALFGADAWQQGARLALAILVGSHLAVQIIKRGVGRPRPGGGQSFAALIATPDQFSFPSGHAAAATSVAIGYSVAFPSTAPLWTAIALGVAFSRVALGVHYPGDVAAGIVLAVVTGAIVTVGG